MPTAKQGIYTVAGKRGSAGSSVTNTTTACCCAACTGLQCLDRTRFFAGQLLSESDLNNEQSYWLAKNRLHNRYLNGWGVVCGMQVVCGECDGWVRVQSGYAIDPCGNDIIVCAPQNFNVLQAIQACCAPTQQQMPNCSPLRYNPAPQCKDATQEWCITIQYQEQASRLVTPLSNSGSQTASTCNCGANGNGSSTSSSSSSTSGSCKSSSTAMTTSATVPAGACEATRTVEGFQLGVVPGAEVAAALEAGNPNSLKSQVELCTLGLAALMEQAPTLSPPVTVQSAYQSACNYLALVTKVLTNATNITLCAILDDLALIQVPTGKEVGYYVAVVADIKKLLVQAYRNCICYTLIPPCPPQPCDSRIVLACVTVQNGEVVQICHFPGRKQLITLQTLGYWLGPLGLDNLGKGLADIFAVVCCETEKDPVRSPVYGGVYYKQTMTTDGVTSGAAMNRIATHYVAQNLGAAVVNAISPGAGAVDLRPMVNTSTDTVAGDLKRRGFTLTMVPVEGAPGWDADAVLESAQYAPAAVSKDQPLTVYTQGKVVVGFDVVDPTTVKIQDLQNQINKLQSQMGQAQTATGQADLAQNPAPPAEDTPSS